MRFSRCACGRGAQAIVRPEPPAGHDAILSAEIGGKDAPMRDEARASIAIVMEELMEVAAAQKLKLAPFGGNARFTNRAGG